MAPESTGGSGCYMYIIRSPMYCVNCICIAFVSMELLYCHILLYQRSYRSEHTGYSLFLCTTPGGANHDINNEPQKPRAHCSVSRNISIHHNPPHQFFCVSKVQTLIEWSKTLMSKCPDLNRMEQNINLRIRINFLS